MDKMQSATFTITADSPQELARLLRRIADALDEGPGESGRPATLEPWPRRPGGRSTSLDVPPLWSQELARDLWDRLETPGARRALSFLAERGERTRVEELADWLGKEPGPALAGTLSPIGRAVSAMGVEPPFRRVRSHYEVDEDFAQAFRALLADARRPEDLGDR